MAVGRLSALYSASLSSIQRFSLWENQYISLISRVDAGSYDASRYLQFNMSATKIYSNLCSIDK